MLPDLLGPLGDGIRDQVLAGSVAATPLDLSAQKACKLKFHGGDAQHARH